MENDPAAMGKIQKVAVTIHERFKVAICLCLIPKNRARSLSTPMAVNINRDETEHNAKLNMKTTPLEYRQRFQCS